MENSYMSKDLGGNMKQNLIPDLTKLGYEGYTFSDTDRKFGGPKKATGTQWSVASMVNQMSGLPMKVPTGKNTYGTPATSSPALGLSAIFSTMRATSKQLCSAQMPISAVLHIFSTLTVSIKLWTTSMRLSTTLFQKDTRNFGDMRTTSFMNLQKTSLPA